MEITKERILDMLYQSIAELNEQRAKEEQLTQTPQTPLLGPGAGLDSLGFVNLVSLVEEKCEHQFGATLVLSDVAGKPGTRDPFETVDTLAEYIELCLTGRLALWR
jgi:acyl carrier protein